ncbi:hypothetical protein Taro_046750 [Colocasia esculenta]|uniref:SKP1-like protein n=1 Tax=Colocasia esculenta TaxID=4460 RepID=A0A843X4J1_COLES|nr:hypothetical protein [Colocasia esculenta]
MAAAGGSGSKRYTLKSRDGEEFEVEDDVAVRSQTIKHLIEDNCADDTIPLANVTGKILALVVEYCRKHAQVETGGGHARSTGLEDQVLDEGLVAWDAEFVKLDQDTLFDLLLAANYLEVTELLDLTCQTVANMMKGKSAAEIRKTFHIVNDYTPEEEQEVRKEIKWAFG